MSKYSAEDRERALRLLAAVEPDHTSPSGAANYVAGQLGIHADTIRRWKRESQTTVTEASRRAHAATVHANVGIVISALALLASVATFLIPVITVQQARDSVVTRYLEALVGVGNASAYSARGMAAEASQADAFAQSIGLLWEAIADGESMDPSKVEAGAVTPRANATYSVCYPRMDFFRKKCSTFGDFEFTDRDRVARFTIDGQPVEQLFRAGDYDKTLTSSDASNQLRAYAASRLWDADYDSEVIVLWIDRASARPTSGRENLTLKSIQAEDGEGKEVTVTKYAFPPSISYWDSYYAAVRVPASARYLYVCFDGVPPGETACDWIYNIR